MQHLPRGSGPRSLPQPIAAPRKSNRFGVNSTTVTQFVIEREVLGAGSLSDVQIREISLRSLQALSAMGPQIQWPPQLRDRGQGSIAF